jgi:hypothetical protein
MVARQQVTDAIQDATREDVSFPNVKAGITDQGTSAALR